MPNFGTTGTVYGADGAPVKTVGATLEPCLVCEDSPGGGAFLAIMREGKGTATLICPNCGEMKTVFSQTLKRPPKPPEPREPEPAPEPPAKPDKLLVNKAELDDIKKTIGVKGQAKKAKKATPKVKVQAVKVKTKAQVKPNVLFKTPPRAMKSGRSR